MLAESVPFKPNIQKLSEQIGLTRNALTEYLHHLEDAGLAHLLHRGAKGVTRLQKPDKIYLGNPNLAFALNPRTPDSGMLRETFFISQVGKDHTVEYAEQGDFRIDQQLVVEVGGPGKGFKQIRQFEHSIVAADGLDIGFERGVPLWLFGFLY